MRRVSARMPIAVGGALVLLAAAAAVPTLSQQALAAPAIASWSQIEGTAWPIRRGLPLGFYIHRNGREVWVCSHGPKRGGLVFIGRIVVDRGTITGPKPVAHEKPGNPFQDAFRQQTPNVLDFKFVTGGHLDGVKFIVNEGQSISFDLRIQGQRTNRVFMGPKPVEVVGSPIICDMTR
jgi:hypothetical protein